MVPEFSLTAHLATFEALFSQAKIPAPCSALLAVIMQLTMIDDAQLFLAVLRGEHLIKGFRNKDIVRVLYPSTPANAKTAQRRSRKVTRLFGMLWTHGLIGKIPRSRSWRVTDKGRRLMTGTVLLRTQDIQERLAG